MLVKIEKIVVLGTNSAYPDTGNKAAYGFLTSAQDWYILDCGAPSGYLHSLGILSRLKAIFISHLHTDHIIHLFDYLQSLKLLNRTDKLVIYGPDSLSELLKKTLPHLFLYADNLPYKLEVKGYKDWQAEWIKVFQNRHLYKDKYKKAILKGEPLSLESYSYLINLGQKEYFLSGDLKDVEDLRTVLLQAFSLESDFSYSELLPKSSVLILDGEHLPLEVFLELQKRGVEFYVNHYSSKTLKLLASFNIPYLKTGTILK